MDIVRVPTVIPSVFATEDIFLGSRIPTASITCISLLVISLNSGVIIAFASIFIISLNSFTNTSWNISYAWSINLTSHIRIFCCILKYVSRWTSISVIIPHSRWIPQQKPLDFSLSRWYDIFIKHRNCLTLLQLRVAMYSDYLIVTRVQFTDNSFTLFLQEVKLWQ